MYDISNKKTTRITTNTADQYDPAMYDKYIVWIDTRNGYQDVYLQDLGTKKQTKITTNAYASCPGIYGNRIIWVDSNVIYTYDLKTKKTTKVLNDYAAYSLTIHGNKILFNEF
jgi:beta propeller repeat protein